QVRLEVVAVNAAVPEELVHLDLVAAIDGEGRLDLAELGLGEGAGRDGEGERREKQRAGERASKEIHLHCGSLILIRLASIPLWARDWRTRLMSSTLVYGPSRTRYQVPLSGRLAGSTFDSKPRIASRAFWLSASAGFWNEPACMK